MLKMSLLSSYKYNSIIFVFDFLFEKYLLGV